jgi:hypothetical protein
MRGGAFRESGGREEAMVGGETTRITVVMISSER